MLLVLASNPLEFAAKVSVSQRGDGGIEHGQVLALGSDCCLGRRTQVSVAP